MRAFPIMLFFSTFWAYEVIAVNCHTKLLRLLDQAKINHHNIGSAIKPMGSVPVTTPRVGRYRSIQSENRLTFLHEIEIAKLISVHPIPNPHRPGSAAKLEELMDDLEFDGFNLATPIQVAVMPTGELRIVGGHHRVEALKRLGNTYVPSEIIIWSELDTMTKKLYVDEIFKPYSLVYPEYYQIMLANPSVYY